MSEISELAEFVAEKINESEILSSSMEAEYRAYFKQDVEKLKNGVVIYVCPHCEKWEIETRSSFANELTIDVAVQCKINNDSVEDGMESISETADAIAKYLFGKNMGPYAWVKTEYYPYHGESLEVARTFVSIVSTTYRGRVMYTPRTTLDIT